MQKLYIFIWSNLFILLFEPLFIAFMHSEKSSSIQAQLNIQQCSSIGGGLVVLYFTLKYLIYVETVSEYSNFFSNNQLSRFFFSLRTLFHTGKSLYMVELI